MPKRTSEFFKEQMRKSRFNKKSIQMRENGTRCRYCGEVAVTFHHKDENQANNRKSNLLPVCNKCHLVIPHQCDKPNFYQENQTEQPYVPVERPKQPLKTVNTPRLANTLLTSVNNNRLYNVSLYNPTTCRKLLMLEGSKRCLKIFIDNGYTEIRSNL